MDWKKTVLFILFLFLGVFMYETIINFFGHTNTYIYLYMVTPLISTMYVLFLIWVMKFVEDLAYLKKIGLFLLFVTIGSCLLFFLNRLYYSIRGVAIYPGNMLFFVFIAIFVMILAKVMKIFNENTTWKKILLFFLYILIGFVIFIAISIFTLHSSFSLLLWLFIAYIAILIIRGEPYAKEKKTILFGLFIIYLILMAVPFPNCSSSSFGIGRTGCTCIGIEKEFGGFGVIVTDGHSSQCIGIKSDYRCYEKDISNPDYYAVVEVPCQ